MALTVIGTPRKYRTDRGWRTTGRAQFTTTALTGELPIDSDFTKLRGPVAVHLLNGPSHVMNIPTGTIATSGATAFNIISPYAGIVTYAAIVSGAAQAAHSTIVFDWHMINKGAAASGTAVVIDRATAGNTLDSDVDAGAASLAAFIPRVLTLTSTTADKTVALGDCLNFVWTAAGSTPTSQTGTSLILKISSDGSTGDERIWVDERASVNTTDGILSASDGGVSSVPRYTVTVNRFSTNPKSGAIFEYSYETGY
jgi:hypothetical protein